MIPRCSQRRTKRQQDWMCFKTQNTQTHRARRTKKMSSSCLFLLFFFWLFCCYLKMSDVPENYQCFPFPFRINEGVCKLPFKNFRGIGASRPLVLVKTFHVFTHAHTYIYIIYIYTHVFIFINAHLHKPSRTGAVVGVHLWTFFFSPFWASFYFSWGLLCLVNGIFDAILFLERAVHVKYPLFSRREGVPGNLGWMHLSTQKGLLVAYKHVFLTYFSLCHGPKLD